MRLDPKIGDLSNPFIFCLLLLLTIYCGKNAKTPTSWVIPLLDPVLEQGLFLTRCAPLTTRATTEEVCARDRDDKRSSDNQQDPLGRVAIHQSLVHLEFWNFLPFLFLFSSRKNMYS